MYWYVILDTQLQYMTSHTTQPIADSEMIFYNTETGSVLIVIDCWSYITENDDIKKKDSY